MGARMPCRASEASSRAAGKTGRMGEGSEGVSTREKGVKPGRVADAAGRGALIVGCAGGAAVSVLVSGLATGPRVCCRLLLAAVSVRC